MLLGWEHVNLTGDYIWNTVANVTENHGGVKAAPPHPGSHPPGRLMFSFCPLIGQIRAFR